MVKPIRLTPQTINPLFLKPFKTKTNVDKLISKDGGFLPSTKTMVLGDPGVGKTTLLLYLLSLLKDRKTLFVSAEMGKIGISKYCKTFPQFYDIDMVFTEDYPNSVTGMFDGVLKNGYDLVIIDSWFDLIRDAANAGELYSETELRLHNILDNNCRTASNNAGKYTSFLIIQQVTKKGQFVGKNTLKHLVDATLHIEFVKNERVMYYSKNRDGDTNRKMSITLDANSFKFEELIDTPKVTTNKITFNIEQKAARMIKIKEYISATALEEEFNLDYEDAYQLAERLRLRFPQYS